MCGGKDCGGIQKGPRRSPKGILSAVTKEDFFSYHFFIKNNVLEEKNETEQLFN